MCCLRNFINILLLSLLQPHSIFCGEFDDEFANTTSSPTTPATTASTSERPETQQSTVAPTTAIPGRKNNSGTKFSPYDYVPPCPCSLNASCGPDCCYCELGCPLPLGINGQPWLNTLYGDKCHNRQRFLGLPINFKPTREFRQGLLEEKAVWSCSRTDVLSNARNPIFDFLCFVVDNSHTSAYFKWRRHKYRKYNSTDLNTASKVPYSWPAVLPSEPACVPFRFNVNVTKTNPASIYANSTSSVTTGRPTTATSPSAGNDTIARRVKRQLTVVNCDQPIPGIENTRLTSSRDELVTMSTVFKQGPWDKLWALPHAKLLGSALVNLKTNRTNVVVTFQPRPKEKITDCGDARQFLHSFGRLWTQYLVNVTHVNSSKASSQIPIKQLNLYTSAGAQVGLNETFPGNCQNIPVGLVINAFHYRDQLVEIQLQNMISGKNASVVETRPDFYVHLMSLNTFQPLKRKLSRFWLQYQLYECPQHYCWRDTFDLSFLPANRAILFVVLFMWLAISTLLYDGCPFDPSAVFN